MTSKQQGSCSHILKNLKEEDLWLTIPEGEKPKEGYDHRKFYLDLPQVLLL